MVKSTSSMLPHRAVARAWSLPLLCSAVVVGAALLSLAREPIPVPGRGEVRALIWPLAAGPLAVVLPGAASVLHRPAERRARRRPACQRLAFLFLVGVLSLPLIFLGAHWFPLAVVGRNAAFLIGLALAAAALVPPGAAWLLPSLVILITWFLSPRAGGQPPADWSLLLQLGGVAWAALTSWLVLLVGLVLFVLVDRPVLSDGIRRAPAVHPNPNESRKP